MTLLIYSIILFTTKLTRDRCATRKECTMKQVISKCPVCNSELKVTRLKCAGCDTVIENDFRLSKFDYLSAEDLYFTETFIRCRGNIKEVEKELKISYPTVRAKLDGIIKALGYEAEDKKDEEMIKREAVLKALEQGEISAEEAIKKLK